MESPLAVVIPAGGGGTRLWPRSRQNTPKQFLDIVTPGRTMLQETVDRVVPALAPAENIFVITNRRHVPLVREQLPDTPTGNVIGEPQGRDSAPAIGLMAALLETRLGPEAIMAVLPADHVILGEAAFRQAIQNAAEAAQEGYLVTLGIPPTGPDTGFGYIHRGQPVSEFVYAVQKFKEKPDRATAEKYLATGEYYWNAGMFIAKVGVLRGLYQEFLPAMEPAFAQLVASLGAPNEANMFDQLFPTLQKISIDFAIVEKAPRVAVVPAEMGWNDVGSWSRLMEVLAHRADTAKNIVVGAHIGVDTTGSLIYSPEKAVTTIGLENLIVIDTPDALLIATKERSEEVKKIVEQLQSEGKHEIL
jgi:mannose-1-phosphate guanylyltransferase